MALKKQTSYVKLVNKKMLHVNYISDGVQVFFCAETSYFLFIKVYNIIVESNLRNNLVAFFYFIYETPREEEIYSNSGGGLVPQI